jgi:GT2 family glycosyltransferase
MVEREFPGVKVIRNPNSGFSKGNNIGLRDARGRVVLVLNPDTNLSPDVLEKCICYMDERPEVGALGCKVLKPDGSLEKGSRRSFPDPLTSFYRLSGLAALFPNSKRFGAYNLTYLSPDQETEVDAISGCFMLMAKAVLDEVGLFDEAFFMYGEDLDLCFRIKAAGHHIYYYPAVSIVHYGGQSTKNAPMRALWHFHKAMWIFYKKHYANKQIFIFNWIVAVGIWLRWAVMSAKSVLFRRVTGEWTALRLRIKDYPEYDQ